MPYIIILKGKSFNSLLQTVFAELGKTYRGSYSLPQPEQGQRMLYFYVLDIFKSIFWIEFYSSGTSINTVLHYYHIELNFYQMSHVLGGYFLGFHFLVGIFWGCLSVTKYFWVV